MIENLETNYDIIGLWDITILIIFLIIILVLNYFGFIPNLEGF